MDPNPVLDASNERLAVTNLYGGTNFPQGRDSSHGLPLGTVGDSPTGELLLKVSLREGTISVGSVDAQGTATAAAPTYVEASDNNLSLDLAGNLRVILGGTQLTPAITTATGNGSVAAGKKYVSFILSSDFAGTILGATFSGTNDAFYDITAPAGFTLAAVAYTISAGNARITSY